jgi:hypothetical protein
MQLLIHRRAEIALRSLQKAEQEQLNHALSELSGLDRAALQINPKFHRVASLLSGKKLFVYKGNRKLLLVLSFDEETCVIEDVVDHDRLARLGAKGGQA